MESHKYGPLHGQGEKMIKLLTVLCALIIGQGVYADSLLIKLAAPSSAQHTVNAMKLAGLKATVVSSTWIEVSGKLPISKFKGFLESSAVVHVQPNYKVYTMENPALAKLRGNKALMAELAVKMAGNPIYTMAASDNPAIPTAPSLAAGMDPLLSQQWSMTDVGAANAWKIAPMLSEVVVAVIDTGVDYTHEDLVQNMWRNPREIPNNGIDDDRNGYVDDVIGWDFLDKDNKPYDLKGSIFEILLSGANPGHGTHCAGNVAATGNNSKGISGVAPKAKIMALRFIGNQGGSTSDAILAIRYAVDNGAKVLSNSWGSRGEDPSDTVGNLALREAVQYAMDKGALFIAAAGNGNEMGMGYDNDTDSKPSYPASYTHENIISVAAIDVNGKLGTFSNWGPQSVDIGAPGVKVLSTTVGGKYEDSLKIPIINFTIAGWDGTSMATPHVAGAAALYWSANPHKTWQEVKAAILSSAIPIPALTGKVTSHGKLNVEELMKR